MSCDKLKHQTGRDVLQHDQFIFSCDITFMLHRRLRNTMTAKQVDVAIDVFIILLPVKYCDLLHHFMLHSSS